VGAGAILAETTREAARDVRLPGDHIRLRRRCSILLIPTHRFVIRRGAATSAVKAIAEFRQDNPETDGNEIDTDVLIAIVECLPVRLRKLGGAGLSAFRAIEAFVPMVPPDHSPNMRLRQA
jgi:hypothetical protein